MTQRAAVVYNPIKVPDLDALTAAGRHVHGPQRLGAEPLWLETTQDDPGVGMCQKADARTDCDVVFVCGGDGTVMAAVTAMAGCDVPLAILPAGTGNLLARNLDLPINDEAACLRIGIGDRTRAIDVASIEDRKFAVMAGLGFDAAIMRDAPEGLKKAVGWPAYVVSAGKHLRGRGIRVTITLDGGRPMHRRVRTVVVGNVGKLQGNIPLLPDAKPDDGILDVVVIATRNVLDWARVGGRVRAARRRTRPADGALHRQARADRGEPHAAAPARRRRHRGRPHDGHHHRAGRAQGARRMTLRTC